MQVLRIAGDVRDYDWGTPGGISRALGGEASLAPEAELWLGAHPSAPSRVLDPDAGIADLAQWESASGMTVPYLLKLLSAAGPLSLQAHPAPEQARAGFDAEEAAGIPRDARERNYRDPFAKPELIVALEDGFEALCGFRPLHETIAVIRALEGASADAAVFAEWERRIEGEDGVRSAFTWLLSGDPMVASLIAEIERIAVTDADRWELPGRISGQYPGDAGIAVSLMLNHVVLRRGESLWLPAGNIHAYLRGTGIELMGPSDNVLRGGMTAKHVDVPELSRVIDFATGVAPRLAPIRLSAHAVTYRPASVRSGVGVPFELLEITGDETVDTGGPATVLLVEGAMTITAGQTTRDLERGAAVFVTDAGELGIRGEGRLYLATV